MEYGFFLGCVIPVRAVNYEISIRRVAQELGINLVDIDGFNCCGLPLRPVSIEAASLLATRDLALAEERGLNLCTGCNGCAVFLTETKKELDEDPSLKKEANEKLARIGREYKGQVEVKHFVRVLYEDVSLERLREAVKVPLENLRVAVHYGCHYLKPSSAYDGFDDPENPRTLDELVQVTGAQSVPYEYKKECCGNMIIGIDAGVSLAIAKEKLDRVATAAIDVMVVICPACGMQFDTNQRKIETDFQAKYGVPVLYYPQLLGLALGIPPKEMALDMNRVKTAGMLEKLGIS